MDAFAQRLRELRTEKNLTQDQLSEKTGLAQGSISNWEIGRSSPLKEHLITLADFFDCTLDYLVGRRED